MTKRTIGRTLRCGALLIAAAMASPASPATGVTLQEFLTVLGAGDQDRLQRYIEDRFDPDALRAASAAERADRLARIYVDSGGFVIARTIASTPDKAIAIGRAKLTDLPSCLVLKTRVRAGQEVITDFETVDLPLASSAALRTPAPTEVAETMAAFMDRLASADTFAGVVLIAKDGRPILHRAYGMASPAHAVPNRLGTRFNIASIGKSMTATAIGQLLDEKRLSLDDKVGQFLPDYPDAAVRDSVTIRHLLTHTSGLGPKSEFTNDPLWPARRLRIRTVGAYLPLITGHPLESEPGAKFSYSNAGFVILGLVIEKITGQSFYDAIASRVFERAGMTRSFYHEADHEDPDMATPLTNFVEGVFPFSASGEPVMDDYGFRLGRRRNATLHGAAKGGSHGGAHVTAEDLLKFMTAVRAARLTSAATARLLTRPQSVGRLGDTKNGFGFEIMSQNGHTIVGHGGGDIGVSAFVYHFNDTGYTAVVLSNYDPRAIRVIARKLRGLLTRSSRGEVSRAPPNDCEPLN